MQLCKSVHAHIRVAALQVGFPKLPGWEWLCHREGFLSEGTTKSTHQVWGACGMRQQQDCWVPVVALPYL